MKKNTPLYEKMDKNLEMGYAPMLTIAELKDYLKSLPEKVRDYYKEHPKPIFFKGHIINIRPQYFKMGKKIPKTVRENLKKWFDDWHYYYSPGNKLTFKLPHSRTDKQITITAREVGEKKLQQLFLLLTCAFIQIDEDHTGTLTIPKIRKLYKEAQKYAKE